LKIGLLYEHTSEPWGGINAFFRNFARQLSSETRWQLSSNLTAADIVLSAGHYRGPGKLLKTSHLKNISSGRWMHHPLGLIHSRKLKKIVFRLDGIRSIYSGQSASTDSLLFGNLPYSDAVVFQSEFCRSSFDSMNVQYPGNHKTIINGANPEVFYPREGVLALTNKLNVLTSSWSTNYNKGFELIARLSEQDDVDVNHVGHWPNDIGPREVNLLGVKNEEEIADYLREAHFLFFPAVNEACSNTVVESLACGVPVIYMKSGGTEEIVGPSHGLGFEADDFDDASSTAGLMLRAREHYMESTEILRAHVPDYHFQETCRGYCEYFEEVLSF
jgi:glycosyltransferase involved in cell wall biosynthesis